MGFLLIKFPVDELLLKNFVLKDTDTRLNFNIWNLKTKRI